MTLNDCLNTLALGVLSNLSIVDTTTNKIKENKLDKIIEYINEGLYKLYNTFSLKEDFIYIELIEGKTRYEISSKHMIPQGGEADYNHYLFKGLEEFNDNLARILSIDSTLDNYSYTLNDPLSNYSIQIPTYNTIVVPTYIQDESLLIKYIATPDKLTSEDLSKEIKLPPFLETALINYVAFLVHSHINTVEAVQNAQKYFSSFTAIINDVISSGTGSINLENSTYKFTTGGWI